MCPKQVFSIDESTTRFRYSRLGVWMRCNNSLDGDARLVLSDIDTEFAVAGERG